MEKSDKIIYTAIIGDYDELIEYKPQPGWRYMCFTDQDLESDVWEIVKVKGADKKQREIKTRPHKFLPEYDMCIWVDGNIHIKMDLDILASKLNDVDFVGMKHMERTTMNAEILACKSLGKDDPRILKEQGECYNKEYEDLNNLIATGILIRRNTKENAKVGDAWWAEIKKWSRRDQISFCYVAEKHKLKFGRIPFLPQSIKYAHKNRPNQLFSKGE